MKDNSHIHLELCMRIICPLTYTGNGLEPSTEADSSINVIQANP